MKNFAFKLVGNLLISVYTENAPANEDADAAAAAFKDMTFDRLRALTFTKGGTHTAAQRKTLHDILGGRELRTAVVTDVPMVRGVVTAVSWFNKSVKAFTPTGWKDAFLYLDIPSSQFERTWEHIHALEREIQRSSKDGAHGSGALRAFKAHP